MIDRGKAANILLVEDNADHAELTLRALKNGNMLNDVFWVKDGEEALDFLSKQIELECDHRVEICSG